MNWLHSAHETLNLLTNAPAANIAIIFLGIVAIGLLAIVWKILFSM